MDPNDNQVGGWLITTQRVMYGWGNLTIEDWPYLPGTDPSTIPEHVSLDHLAKAHRSQHYQRVFGLEEIKQAILSKNPVLVSLSATEHWFDAERGEIQELGSESDIIGNHCVVIIRYFDVLKYLRFVNSWGKDWGDSRFGPLPYNYYLNHSFESWLTAVGSDSRQAAQIAVKDRRFVQKSADNVLQLMWAVPDFLKTSSPVHCREIYDNENDERIGWAFATTRGGFLDFEDLFVRPTYRQRGYASQIAQMLLDLSTVLGLPLRLQVSFADVSEENREALNGILRILRLTLRNTDQRSLAYVALPGRSTKALKPIIIPERATLSRGFDRVKGTVFASTIIAGTSELVELTALQNSELEEDLYWRREAERITPSNEQLRAMIGKFSPPPGTFDDEEMPY